MLKQRASEALATSYRLLCRSIFISAAILEDPNLPIDEDRLNLRVVTYAENGHIREAQNLFDRLPERSAEAWSSLIAAYARKGHLHEGAELFRAMDLEGVHGTRVAFHAILSICGNLGSLAQARIFHEEITPGGLDALVSIGSAVIDMYGKCGSPTSAAETFNKMPTKNVISWSSLVSAYAMNGHLVQAGFVFERMPMRNAVSWTVIFRAYAESGQISESFKTFSAMPERTGIAWNAMVSAYAQNGHPRRALELFKLMDLEGAEINMITFISAIDACGSAQALAEGELLREEISLSNLDSETAVGSALVNMYGKCGDLENACEAFRGISSYNIRAFNTMLAAYALNGHVEVGESVFDCMPKWNVVTWNTMMSGYVQSGDLRSARETFESMKQRNTISWNTMVRAYGQHGHSEEALVIFQRMDMEGVPTESVTIMGALDACGSLQARETGVGIHEEALSLGLASDAAVTNSLITMYGKLGDVEAATIAFKQMPSKDLRACSALITAYAQNGYLEDAEAIFCRLEERDVVAWNALIAGFSQNWRVRDAVRVFLEMDLEGAHKDRVTYVTILYACASVGLKKGEFIARSIEDTSGSLVADVELQVAILHLHSRCGNLENARQIFTRFKGFNLAASSAMVGVLARNGHLPEAKRMFDQMEQHDYVSWKVMMGGFCANGEEDEATEMLYVMPQWRTGAWNTVIEGYAQSMYRIWEGCSQDHHIRKAYVLFQYMDLEGVAADKFTFINVLGACGRLVDVSQGREVHSLLVDCGWETEIAVAPALINMYGNHSCLGQARDVFERMERQNAASWSAVVAAYAHNGESSEAIDLFRMMQLKGVNTTRSFFTTILAACSHGGLFKEGLELSVSMSRDFGIGPDLDLYVSMIDIVGRVGKLGEALELLQCMPYYPDMFAWTALLGACRTHGDSEMAAVAAFEMIHLQPNNGGGYAVLSNIFAGT